jgi:hypothetical protein
VALAVAAFAPNTAPPVATTCSADVSGTVKVCSPPVKPHVTTTTPPASGADGLQAAFAAGAASSASTALDAAHAASPRQPQAGRPLSKGDRSLRISEPGQATGWVPVALLTRGVCSSFDGLDAADAVAAPLLVVGVEQREVAAGAAVDDVFHATVRVHAVVAGAAEEPVIALAAELVLVERVVAVSP